MSTLNGTLVSIADALKRRDPNNKTARIIELLDKTNSLTKDMTWKEGNLPTGERVTCRTGLPTVGWRAANEGVAKSKSTTSQFDVSCGMLEGRSEIDVDVAALNGDIGAFRLSEAYPFLEAMNQEMESTLWYGNSTTAPKEFTGFQVTYNSISTGANKDNVVNANCADSSANSSIWLVVWGENTVYGVYPKLSEAGLKHEDLGIGDALDGSYNRFRAYMDLYQWKCGLVIKDWRYAVRIANIGMTKLVAEANDADLTKNMTKAIYRIPNLSAGRAVFYCNRSVMEYLDIQRQKAVASGGGTLWGNVDGMNRPTFRSIPIQISDSLLESEETVS